MLTIVLGLASKARKTHNVKSTSSAGTVTLSKWALCVQVALSCEHPADSFNTGMLPNTNQMLPVHRICRVGGCPGPRGAQRWKRSPVSVDGSPENMQLLKWYSCQSCPPADWKAGEKVSKTLLWTDKNFYPKDPATLMCVTLPVLISQGFAVICLTRWGWNLTHCLEHTFGSQRTLKRVYIGTGPGFRSASHWTSSCFACSWSDVLNVNVNLHTTERERRVFTLVLWLFKRYSNKSESQTCLGKKSTLG